MSEQFLKVKNISKAFAGVQALDKVNLTINKGEIHCLAGENGSGKSTLIKVISGFYKPDQGQIIINNKTYSSLNPIDSIREGIQIIYQDFSVFPNLTVAENIALNSELAKNTRIINWKNVYKTAKQALEKIEVDIDLNSLVENLSVADKQLIAISRALLQNAKLIIMDEPTTALTNKEVKSLFKVIKGLQDRGISILFVSHKLDEVFEISEKITIIRNGKNVITGDTQDFDRDKFVYYMTGREISNDYYIASSEDNKCLFEAKNISRKGNFADVSFKLYKGEILGITGLLGSGRTELAKALFGMNPIQSGEIYIEGKPTNIQSVQDAIDNKIAYVPEDRLTEGLFLEQSIGKNIVVSIADYLTSKGKLLDKQLTEKEIQQWIDRLSIVAPSAKLPVKALSGGNQQRVVLAKWLATNPKILILNGPTVGVDIGSKIEIHKIIRKLAQQGVGIIIISDDLPEVMYNCNRILIMKKGRIVGEYSREDISETKLAQQLSG